MDAEQQATESRLAAVHEATMKDAAKLKAILAAKRAARQQKRVAELREAMREDVAMLQTIIHGKTEKEEKAMNERTELWLLQLLLIVAMIVQIYFFVTLSYRESAFIFFFHSLFNVALLVARGFLFIKKPSGE